MVISTPVGSSHHSLRQHIWDVLLQTLGDHRAISIYGHVEFCVNFSWHALNNGHIHLLQPCLKHSHVAIHFSTHKVFYKTKVIAHCSLLWTCFDKPRKCIEWQEGTMSDMETIENINRIRVVPHYLGHVHCILKINVFWK